MKKIIPVIAISIIIISYQDIKAKQNHLKAYVTAKSGLIMRKGPKKGEAKIDVIPYNTKVKVIKVTMQEERINGIFGPWAYVKYKNKKGWVFSGYLDFNKDNKLQVTYGKFHSIESGGDFEYFNITDNNNKIRGFLLMANTKGIPISKIESGSYKDKKLKITWKKTTMFLEMDGDMHTFDTLEKIELSKN